ncbi:hypothetical protein ABIB73_004947 [Bradyrhizobium sp. F1.4.3]
MKTAGAACSSVLRFALCVGSDGAFGAIIALRHFPLFFLPGHHQPVA